MKISVLIPTYRRPQELWSCLRALVHQERQPDEIVVVVRESDVETHDVLQKFRDVLTYYSANQNIAANLNQFLKVALVSVPGQVAAINAGLRATTGDIVSIADDDGIPSRHWLAEIETRSLADSYISDLEGKTSLYFGQTSSAKEHASKGRSPWFSGQIGKVLAHA